MNVYPMAPMPKNDHSIVPADPHGAVELAYYDYAKLFDAMHGARWLLTAHPAAIVGRNGTASAGNVNVLTLPASSSAPGATGAAAQLPQLLVPIMLSPQIAVTLTLNLAPAVAALGWPAVARISLTARYPNASASPADVPLGDAKSVGGGSWQASIPLLQGCAMVTATLTAE